MSSDGTAADEFEHYLVENGQRTLTFEQDGDVKRRLQYGPTGDVLFDQIFNAVGNPTLQAEQNLQLLLGDHQHSTRVVLAHDAGDVAYVQQSLSYTPFGQLLDLVFEDGSVPIDAPESMIAASFGFQGMIYDVQAGHYRTAARVYDPHLGRFISEDPIQDGANWYAFAGNDPVNYADPSGLSMQGYPLAGGYSGNRTSAPAIKPGYLPAANVGNPFATTTFGGFVDVDRGRQILGFGPISTPTAVSKQPTAVEQFNRGLSANSNLTSLTHTVDPLKSLISQTQQTRAYWQEVERNSQTIVSRETLGTGWAGQSFTNNAAIFEQRALESTTALGAFGNQFAAQMNKVSAFTLNTVVGHVTPAERVTYGDGRTVMVMGGPDTRSLANQATLFGPMILAGASRPAAAAQPGRGFVLGETSELSYPLGTVDEQVAAFRTQQRINRGQLLEAPSKPHGNSLNYVGDTHVYAIKGPNGTHKIGESMQGVRVSDGASIRAEQQVRQLNRTVGPGHTSEIRGTFPDKASAREYETNLIERFRRMFGNDTLPGNLTNR